MHDDAVLTIVFKNSGEKNHVPLSVLTAAVTGFLDHLAVQPLIEPAFADIIGTGSGGERLARLLEASAFPGDAKSFFTELLMQLGRSDAVSPIEIGGIRLPHLLLMAVLEVVLPGNRSLSIRTTEHLEQATNIRLPEAERADMQKVLDTYPVRLSMHTIRQMRVSRNVACQYLPFVEELDPVGHTNTWIGQFHQGLLEQMYQNRVIFLLNMSCPVYCRFCFRKHKEARNQANPTVADVHRAVEHVRNSPLVKEIVITGGDPFMNRENIACAIEGLKDIEHVQTLRLATRSIAYYPHMFLGNDGELLLFLKRTNLELQERGKRLEIATHFIHTDEISPQSLQLIAELTDSGVTVYIQTPFLNDCNDKGPELVRLFSLLRGAGAEMHYIYIPCSPIHGNSLYWAPIDRGLAVARYLRAHLSDRAIPRLCTATPIGKMDWHTSGWAVEPVAENDNFIWIRSPYTPDYFKQFAPIANKLENIRVNAEGTIDIQYMARIDDASLFLGSRPFRLGGGVFQPEGTEAVVPMIRRGAELSSSLVDTGSALVSRVHETRVELALGCTSADLSYIVSYIRSDPRITDVLLTGGQDSIDELNHVEQVVQACAGIWHVNAVRLRSLAFNYEPEKYRPEAIDRLAGCNRLRIARPLRLEIETQFLVADEVLPVHGRLARLLAGKGITVYSNTPLLGRINDTPEAIHLLANRLRQEGIEFHHLFLAGLPIQEYWNNDNPVALYDVVDIATRVRRDGSGREVPRYIIRTPLGEADFGLSASLAGEKSDLRVTLLAYDLAYYQGMSADFTWPDYVSEDENGRPVLPITGLLKTTDFPLS